MILVVGEADCAPEKLPQALAISVEHVLRSRAEPGCLSHDVTQDAQNPHRLVFVERWADKAALLDHVRLPASQAFGKELFACCVRPPSMDIYQSEATGLK